MKKFTIWMVTILMAIPLFAKTYSLQEAIINGSAEICKKIDGNINNVVVVDVQSDSESLSDYIYSELNYNFVCNLKKTAVAERNEFTLSLIKKEFEYQNSGEVSDVTIQSVGNSLGADCVVLGKIEDSSSGWKFTLKAVQVETKKILSVWSGTISKNDKDVKYIISKKTFEKSEENIKSNEDIQITISKEPSPLFALKDEKERATWCEKDGYALVTVNGKTKKQHYWLYDSYKFHNGDISLILDKIVPIWFSHNLDYFVNANYETIYPNRNLADSVKRLMKDNNCDVCITFSEENYKGFDYVYVNSYDKDTDTYATYIFAGVKNDR